MRLADARPTERTLTEHQNMQAFAEQLACILTVLAIAWVALDLAAWM